ncbi:Hypothetical protein, putative, partial [Bodo saltans]
MCPVATPSGLVCNGQGLCLGEASGAVCACNATHCGHACEFSDGACSACSSPHLYGPSCLQVCPGNSSSSSNGIITTCSGNGYCLNGTTGSGRCVCSFGFATDDCSQQCARNGSGVVCSSPRGFCNKADASCICSAGYAGATCELACPTGIRILSNGNVTSANEVAVCSGQGPCDPVNGTCGCTAGYVGAACSVRCSDYCNHGECDVVAPYTCRCHRSEALGFWAGSSCDVCDAAYTGSRCTTPCPVDADSGLPCGGRGLCVASGPSAATCDCSVNRNGTWAGDACTLCAPGYFGSSCSSECPGSACSPCSGHGTCADGTTGTGLCSCFRTLSLGFWAGTECAQCASGYYGELCTFTCSFGGKDATAVCAGHGTCGEGTTGDGRCSCATGFSGPACDECGEGSFGPNCTACPTLSTIDTATTAATACSGHGTCDAGIDGTGVCTCALGFGGAHCGFACSVHRNITCGTNGTCVSTSTCSCVPPRALGADGACSSCVVGYWGPTCTFECPGGAAHPCSSHGTCDTSTGLCTCDASSTLGYFGGPSCSSCSPFYRSPFCNISCPLNASTGMPCSGRGTCWGGKCGSCGRAANAANDTLNSFVACGLACEKTNEQCTGALHLCPRGYYSANCTLLCPGATLLDPATTSCTGNGYCNSDNGTCVCSRGYWGDACSGTCPGGAASPCSNRGECSSDTGECTCDGTAYGLACEYPCPGGYNDPCSGSGVCGPTGACACFASTALGFFAGTACDRCAPYYSGDACNVSCDPRTGVVVGKSCVCAPGFVGADCSLACPLSDDSLICSDRGTCRAAASDAQAVCVCDSDYYGTACGVYCTAAACASSFGLKHAQCNATTGACECQDNDAGHFGGATCDDCATLYWGPECDRACPCNGRGSCNRYTARCTCFAGNHVPGHYAGSSCSLCATGYIGVSCEIRNTEFSVGGISSLQQLSASEGAAALSSSALSPAVLFRDGAFDVLYSCGTSSIAAFSSEGWGNGTLTYLGQVGVSSNDTLSSVASIDVHNESHIAVRTFTTTAPQNDVSSNQTLQPTTSVLVFHRGAGAFGGGRLVVATPLSSLSFAPTTTGRRTLDQSLSLVTSNTENFTLATYDAATNMLAAVAVNTTTDSTAVHLRSPDLGRGNDAAIVTLVEGAATFIGFVNISDNSDDSTASASHVSSFVTAVVVTTQRSMAALSPTASWWFAIYVLDIATGGVLALRRSTDLVGGTVTCNHTSGTVLCPLVPRCLASTKVGFLLCSISVYMKDHSLLVSIPLTNLTAGAPLLLEVPEGGNVSAAAFDVLDNCVLLGMAPFAATTPSSVYRVRVLPNGLTLVSQLRFALAGAAYPVVQQMLVNSTSRSLYASLLVAATSSSSASSTASVQHINLFGIWAVDPPVVDRDGGTLVTYIGTGFIANPQPMCVLTDDTGVIAEAPALVSDTNTVYCNATLSLAADSICDTATLNLRYANRTTATTLVTMLRPLSATLLSAMTALGTAAATVVSARSLQREAVTVTLVGYGFVAGATAAACRHEDMDGRSVYFTAPNATYVNSTLVLCRQPAGIAPTPPGSVLRYSHDGFVYSASSAMFAVVGDFSGVRLSHTGTTSVLVAGATTAVPALWLETVDRLGNLLGPYDDSILAARCSLASPAVVGDSAGVEHGIVNQTSLRRSTAAGVAVFSDIVLVTPASGSLFIYCYAAANISSIGAVEFTIITGPPSTMMITSPRAAWRSGVLTSLSLDPSPELAVSDSAGNVISDLSQLPATVTLAYTNTLPVTNADGSERIVDYPVLTSASVAEDGTYTFSGVSVRTPFGQVVQLRFTADGIADSLTLAVAQELCTPSEYGVVGTFSCSRCPA